MQTTKERKQYVKNWTKNNPELVRKYIKDYQGTEKYKKTYRKWKEKNRKKINELETKRRIKNPEKFHEIKKKHRRTLKGKFGIFKSNAQKRNHEVEITLNGYTEIVLQPCVYCGEREENRSIDRIDNNKGYLKENCASCCPTCNYMKRMMSVKDFIEHIYKVNRHNGL